ncbi:hypothetical protein GGI05_005347 [Coemansia sp. RSA 2603]|nr:hypothetical protein GGI05_005347 [Coemansia sp. RSA 2603]
MDALNKALQDSRMQKLEELSVLEDELSNLRADASVYTQRTKTPLFFKTTQPKALEATQQMLSTLVGDAWAAVHGVAVVCSVVAQAVCRQRLDDTWDWRTQASRDLLVRWTGDVEARRGLQLLVSAREWLAQHVLRSYKLTELLATEPYAVPAPVAARCGRWGTRLTQMSQTAQPALAFDLIETTQPACGSARVALLLHGGAYVTGSRKSYRTLAVRMSRELRLAVYVAEYRLAPETKYPGQLYDALRALAFLESQGHAAGSVVVVGDSAGGNLALALWQASRAPLAALVLLSPRVNVVSRSGSWARNLHRDILPVFDWQTGSLAMLLSAADRVADDVFLAPVYAHWESAPRMLVQVGTGEVMLDDVREFVRRASREARVVYAEYQGAFHVFQAAPLGANGAGEAWRQAGDFVRALG